MVSEKTKSILSQISDYFKGQPILRAWLFGSYAKNEQTQSSDIDILVDYDKSHRISLLTISNMMIELEDMINIRVDLVENGRVKDFAVESVNNDRILFYERQVKKEEKTLILNS